MGGHGHAEDAHGHGDAHLSAGAQRYQQLTPALFGEVRAHGHNSDRPILLQSRATFARACL